MSVLLRFPMEGYDYLYMAEAWGSDKTNTSLREKPSIRAYGTAAFMNRAPEARTCPLAETSPLPPLRHRVPVVV